jgi:hypothetical protein
MRRFTLLFAVLLTGGVITNTIAIAQDHQHHMADPTMEQSKEQTKEVYSCPMHPEVFSDKPGKCPKCGMTLQKVTATEEKHDMGTMPMKMNDTTCNTSNKMNEKVGGATYEKSIDGFHVQVWIITQEEHKKKMGDKMKDDAKQETMDKNMKHDMAGMEGMMHGHGNMEHKDKMDAMMSGTHHIMVFVTDESTNKPVNDAAIEVVSLSSSKKSATTNLSAMRGHFGGGLSLTEKGNYLIAISLKAGYKESNIQFVYNQQ